MLRRERTWPDPQAHGSSNASARFGPGRTYGHRVSRCLCAGSTYPRSRGEQRRVACAWLAIPVYPCLTRVWQRHRDTS